VAKEDVSGCTSFSAMFGLVLYTIR
ncbi:hypothetical protein, partial [Sicyoidochytrium minutum DNA virus]